MALKHKLITLSAHMSQQTVNPVAVPAVSQVATFGHLGGLYGFPRAPGEPLTGCIYVVFTEH